MATKNEKVKYNTTEDALTEQLDRLLNAKLDLRETSYSENNCVIARLEEQDKALIEFKYMPNLDLLLTNKGNINISSNLVVEPYKSFDFSKCKGEIGLKIIDETGFAIKVENSCFENLPAFFYVKAKRNLILQSRLSELSKNITTIINYMILGARDMSDILKDVDEITFNELDFQR